MAMRPGRTEPATEVKSSPVDGRRQGADRIVPKRHLYGLGAEAGKPVWKVQTQNYVHGTPSIVNGVAHFAGCDEGLHAVDVKTGKERMNVRPRLHRIVAGAGQQRRLLRHLRQPGAGARSRFAQGPVALRASRSQIPVLFVGGGGRRHGCARRTGPHGARARCQDRAGALDAHDARPHRFVAGHCRRPGLRRIERRPASTAWIWRAGRWPGNTTRAPRSARRPRSPQDES